MFRDSVTVSQVTVGRDNTVTQHQHAAAGFEELATAMRHVSELLPRIGLSAPDAEDAAEHVSDVIAETTAAEPDPGRIRRALRGLRTFLQPVADQAVSGVGEGAHELAKEALGHLQQFVS
ncbi:hypothetical protein UK23_42525 [Lentzea aerocolonigenes]|uniref:Uncharacterized protein n=1 Tax=Lentzea aerocolonigenes TaxID=68170 RepID=A0A0F0GHJ7_LENAE|nr:hypothetical protein UK23_42525 [Lentzea aerocolonigenes]